MNRPVPFDLNSSGVGLFELPVPMPSHFPTNLTSPRGQYHHEAVDATMRTNPVLGPGVDV
jgi:hypothetical protein